MIPILLAASLVLDVPFVPQDKDTCGAAALAMVLRYWRVPVTHGEIAAALLEPELRGIPGSKLEAFARERGLRAVAHAGDVGHLRAHLGKGRPLIVALGAGRRSFHDVVVIGYDETSRALVVHDPAEGAARPVSERAFEKRWKDSGRWTLLVVPEGP